MKKLFLLTLAVLSVPVLAGAQALMLVPSDARTAGMAGAVAALDANAFASSVNVSAAALTENTASFAFDYGMWSPTSMGVASFGGFYRFGNAAVALDARYFNEKPYELVSDVAKVIGTYKPTDILATLGFAYKVADPLSVGVSARLFSSSIAEKVSGSAFCADVNVTYRKDGLSAMAGVANLGSKLSYGSSSYALPALAKGGMAYSIAGLKASAEADYLFSGGLMAGLGLDYCIADIVSVRAGYHYGDAQKALASYASLGLGAQFSGFSLDLAFLTASETIGNSLFFGVGYSF